MSKLLLNLIDQNAETHREVHTSVADAAIAALSAEPETIDELLLAGRRFRESGFGSAERTKWQPGLCSKPAGAGLCLIDLPSKLIVCRSSHASPSEDGFVLYEQESGPSVRIWFRLAPEWEVTDNLEEWPQLAAARREMLGELPRLDVRKVLYGPELWEFLVAACCEQQAAGAGQDGPEASALTEIHASWLMTPRKSLAGSTPRELLLKQQDWIDFDLQSRRDQWSLLDRCPPGLDRDSRAFREAGFGTHEIIMYYDLVRHLLNNCWGRVQGNCPDRDREIAQLERDMQEWLRSPSTELLEGHSPEGVIESERRRIPLAVSGAEAMVDCDCPLCQMMEDGGPVFLHLDGCHMEEDFAFSFHKHEEEWESERREWEVMARQWDEERETPRDGERESQAERLWQRSQWDSELAESPEIGADFLMIAIAACLAELGLDLKESKDSAPMVAVLNHHFGNLRDVVKEGSGALLKPVVERLTDELQEVVDRRPDLTLKCNDLQRRLDDFTNRVNKSRSRR